jgi:hypothetical protein
MIPVALLIKKLLLLTGSVTFLCAVKCAFISGSGFDPSKGVDIICAMKCIVYAAAQVVLPSKLLGSAAVSLGMDSLIVSVANSTWKEQDDPVMGGGSKGVWAVQDGIGVWQGTVTNVTFLKAPGFCSVRTVSLPVADASAYIDGGFLLKVRSSTPEYKGFKLRFESPSIPAHHGQHGGSAGSHAQGFEVPASQNGEWQSVFLPFNGFSWDHSDYTGDCATQDPDGFQHRCCSKENPDVCPTSEQLQSIDSFKLYAEGVQGDFQLDINEIVATPCAPKATVFV